MANGDEPTGGTDRPADAELPFATAIVPVKDGLNLLQVCVDALLEQDYPTERFEVIVVDNGSAVSPGPQLPDDPRLIVLAEPTPGSYRARNLAVAHARGDVLAFTDADCRPEPDWLRQAAGYLVRNPDVAMIGGQVRLSYRNGEPVTGPEWFEFVEGFPQQKYLDAGFAVTANMITRRSVIDQVGSFDGTLLSGGDAEWGRRVRDAGGGQRYLPEALVHHPARDTWTELRTKAARTTTGIVRRTHKNHRHPRRRIARLLVGQVYRSVTLPLAVRRIPALPAGSPRRAFVATRWRVDLVIAAVLVRGLFASDHAS